MQLKSVLAMSVLLMGSAAYAAVPFKNISEAGKVNMTLDMDAKRFSISGACNIINGNATFDEHDVLSVGLNGLATTMRACGDEANIMQKRVEGLLENYPKVLRQGNALYLVGTIEGEKESVYLPITLDMGSFKDITAESYEKTFIYVSHKQIPCTTDESRTCLQIRDNKEDQWRIYEGTIEGFNPEPNIAYRLRLKEYNSDKDNVRWVLDMFVEQEVIK